MAFRSVCIFYDVHCQMLISKVSSAVGEGVISQACMYLRFKYVVIARLTMT